MCLEAEEVLSASRYRGMLVMQCVGKARRPGPAGWDDPRNVKRFHS
jgi:hypothetical protein